MLDLGFFSPALLSFELNNTSYYSLKMNLLNWMMIGYLPHCLMFSRNDKDFFKSSIANEWKKKENE